MTSVRNARFPLAVLNLAEELEGEYHPIILDGNIDRDFIASAERLTSERRLEAVGITVMGGPQLRTAIAVSKAIRARSPKTPIVWGGAFPTHCADACLSAPYVDYVVRGQGEETLVALLASRASGRSDDLGHIAGLSWRSEQRLVHNEPRAFSAASLTRRLSYERLANPARYLPNTYLGRRTAAYQAALGCRFRCTFCGVANMFRGKTALTSSGRLEQDLEFLSRELGADSVQFYDHNFFDREVDMVPLLEILARFELPWWCYARTDALVNLSARAWALVEKSRLRMAYVGAESPNDRLLHDIRKGTRADQTLAAIEVCRGHGVTPELSFMLAPPDDPEGETEKTFEFIHLIKRRYPQTEVMIYIYTPLPTPPGGSSQASGRSTSPLRDAAGAPVLFPATPEEWAQPQWHAYWCHVGAPWLSERLRRRIHDFTTVLGCRFPTVQDVHAPAWGKAALRGLASWRYRFKRYDNPWELDLWKKVIGLRDPRVLSL
jgi:radical SAM superfamily enzyme YgiQ (UPF0313 family)